MSKRQLTLDDIREAIYSLNDAQLSKDVRMMKDEALLLCQLEEDLGMDSLDIAELTLSLENRCNICFPKNIMDDIRRDGVTVQGCLDVCNNQMF